MIKEPRKQETFCLSQGTCAYQGVSNVSFSEDFAYVLNNWAPMAKSLGFDLEQFQFCQTLFLKNKINNKGD